MDKKFTVVQRKDVPLDFEGETGSVLGRAIHEAHSDVLGAGYFRVNGDAARLDLPYDEIAFCLEGVLKLTVDGVVHEVKPGDFAFIPKGTDVIFDGDNCVCAYAIQPVDWRNAG